MPDEIDHLFKRLERNRFAAGNDPNQVLRGHSPSLSNIGPAGFVSEMMRDGSGRVANDEFGVIVEDPASAERVRLGKLSTDNYGLRVTNPSGTVIVDGSSDMFRIAASGTQTCDWPTGMGSNGENTTLTGLGTFVTPPVVLHALTFNDAASSSFRTPGMYIGYVAALAEVVGVAFGASSLNGSDQLVISTSTAQSGTTFDGQTAAQRYHVLEQAAI